MLNVFVELSDGRMMHLEDLVRDYERFLNKESLKKVATDKSTVSKPEVGEWFHIDREVIDKNKVEIFRKCNEAGDEGKAYWKRFEVSNQIADENPDQYSRLIETYIFKRSWHYKTEQEMRDMCEKVGEGMCDEIISDLELQMRICNGESTTVLFEKADKLPRVRFIKLRDGGTGYLGGGHDDFNFNPPAVIRKLCFTPFGKVYNYTPCAFRRVLL